MLFWYCITILKTSNFIHILLFSKFRVDLPMFLLKVVRNQVSLEMTVIMIMMPDL